jgi:hypothetical protein
MLQSCYQTKKSNKKLVERQVKDNTEELETNKREWGSTPTSLSQIFGHHGCCKETW